MSPAPRRRGGGRRRGAGRPARPRIDVEPLKPTAEPPDVQTFDYWPLHEDVQAAIAGMDIVKPTPIQSLAIGPILEGKDVIAKAETGTGKTLAFGAPMISKVDPARRTVLGLVLSPTRELAEQVHNVLEQLGAAREMRTALIVGGEDMVPQVKALQAGAQVVVGTPGRVLDLMGQGFLSFPWTEFVVLDEADKMLEIGFIDDVKKILDAANEYRQTLLFSATFPPALLELARGYTTDPAEIATAAGHSTVDTISQRHISVDEDEKADLLGALIERSKEKDVFLVFCDRRTDVDRLLRRMERRRFPVKALHGGYDQAARFRVMTAFRQKEVKALLATDVASRGLDVVHVTHVVNFGVPRDAADYTHRIGRTGRAGRQGIAITLVSPSDRRRWDALRSGTPFEIEEGHTIRDLLKAPKDPKESAEKDQAEERPSSEQSSRGSGEREERPRREQSSRGSGEREERPRREQTSRGSGESQPHPEQKRTITKEAPASAAKAPTGFGQGLKESSPTRKTREPRAPEPKPEPKPKREEPTSPPSGGFGTGV